MNSFRNDQIYISSECRFYLNLKAKLTVKGVPPAKRTLDECADCDLINLYTTEHPEWVIAWERREQLRQEHRKQLTALENEALKLSPELEVNHVA